MKNNIKIIISILLGLVIIISLIFIIKEIEKVERHNDVNKYNEYLNGLIYSDDVHSNLSIFPKNINIEDVESFEYLTSGGLFDGSYLFYIIINYNGEEYLKEVNRIKNIKATFDNNYKYILEEDLKYKTYITICDGNGSYEYAMLDNNKIVYVFRQIFYYDNNLDSKYVLDYIVPNKLRDISTDGYNMYYLYNKYGVGYMEELN